MLQAPLQWQTFEVIGEPIPKPRMTKADVWKKRKCVVEYRAWADAIRKEVCGTELTKIDTDGDVRYHLKITFFLPIPESTKGTKREKLYGIAHNIRPDIDNLSKGVMDALFEKDSVVCDLHAMKFYIHDGTQPRAVISMFRRESLSSTSSKRDEGAI